MPLKKKPVESDSDSETECSSSSNCSTLVASQPSDDLVDHQKRRKLDEISELFVGGHGLSWEPILRPVIEEQSNWKDIIGQHRDRSIVPIRQMTFQAIKSNPASKWKVIIFGQNPYPRVESATGIAMFDNTFESWDDKRFGVVTSLRCMLKSACMYKYGLSKTDNVASIRKILQKNEILQPAQWFQSLLYQGVLLLNATLTTGGPGRADHSKFWNPIISEIIKYILSSSENDRVVFAWWGNESLKVRKKLEPIFKQSKVTIAHIENPNPAAQGDIFCSEESPFEKINNALGKKSHIEWLPNTAWLENTKSKKLDRIGDFITTTKELHKMYLDRLRDGLDVQQDKGLTPITGIINSVPMSLVDACESISWVLQKAEDAVQHVIQITTRNKKQTKIPFGMTIDEAAAVYLYTSPILFKKVNDALRDSDRTMIKPYTGFLKILFSALAKLERDNDVELLYRGVSLDFSKSVATNEVTVWWGISSCTSSRKVAEQFMGKTGPRTLFCITPSTAPVSVKILSVYSAEDEYILRPGTQFKVKNVVKKNQITEVHLQELAADPLVS